MAGESLEIRKLKTFKRYQFRLDQALARLDFEEFVLKPLVEKAILEQGEGEQAALPKGKKA